MTTLPIPYSLEERQTICFSIAADICLEAEYYVEEVRDRLPQEGYLRAVYVLGEDSAAAERMAGVPLQSADTLLGAALRRCVEGLTPARATPCWLTLLLEDGCILHQALFCVSMDSEEPQQWQGQIDLEERVSQQLPPQQEQHQQEQVQQQQERLLGVPQFDSRTEMTPVSTKLAPLPPVPAFFRDRSSLASGINYSGLNTSARRPVRGGSLCEPAESLHSPQRDSQLMPDYAIRDSYSSYRDDLWQRADSVMAHGELLYNTDTPPAMALVL